MAVARGGQADVAVSAKSIACARQVLRGMQRVTTTSREAVPRWSRRWPSCPPSDQRDCSCVVSSGRRRASLQRKRGDRHPVLVRAAAGPPRSWAASQGMQGEAVWCWEMRRRNGERELQNMASAPDSRAEVRCSSPRKRHLHLPMGQPSTSVTSPPAPYQVVRALW